MFGRSKAKKHQPANKSIAIEALLALAADMQEPRIIESGVKRSDPQRCTMHRDWFPKSACHIGTDFEDGLDVDVVADLHTFSDSFGINAFDILLSFSTFEHVKYPWVAAAEIARVMARGGLIFIQTHQTFPIHAYPHDYWRFTKEALEGLFCRSIGFEIIESEYVFPCDIVSEQEPSITDQPSYLNVHLLARKLTESGAPHDGDQHGDVTDWRKIYTAD